MACINESTRDAWQHMADEASKQRPYVGRRVKVVQGRKRLGETGTVIRHERDRFQPDVWRYGTDASMHLRDMQGRRGFVCVVRFDGGGKDWIKSQYLECEE